MINKINKKYILKIGTYQLPALFWTDSSRLTGLNKYTVCMLFYEILDFTCRACLSGHVEIIEHLITKVKVLKMNVCILAIKIVLTESHKKKTLR